MNEIEKFSYALGLGLGSNLLAMNVRELDVTALAQAITDVVAGNAPVMSHTEARNIVNKFFAEMEEKINAENIEMGKKFLAENALKEGVQVTASGLQYKVIEEGSGKKPTANDRVRCHYEGRFINGGVFDSSIQRGTPADFGVKQVIQGWQEALPMMCEGAKWQLYIPHTLAYGKEQAGEIPPYSTLIFDVELIKVL